MAAQFDLVPPGCGTIHCMSSGYDAKLGSVEGYWLLPVGSRMVE
jgi:hypothetical protein